MALVAMLDLKVKIIIQHNDDYFIRFVMPKLVGNDLQILTAHEGNCGKLLS